MLISGAEDVTICSFFSTRGSCTPTFALEKPSFAHRGFGRMAFRSSAILHYPGCLHRATMWPFPCNSSTHTTEPHVSRNRHITCLTRHTRSRGHNHTTSDYSSQPIAANPTTTALPKETSLPPLLLPAVILTLFPSGRKSSDADLDDSACIALTNHGAVARRAVLAMSSDRVLQTAGQVTRAEEFWM